MQAKNQPIEELNYNARLYNEKQARVQYKRRNSKLEFYDSGDHGKKGIKCERAYPWGLFRKKNLRKVEDQAGGKNGLEKKEKKQKKRRETVNEW